MVSIGILMPDVELIHQACELVGETRHHFLRSAGIERAMDVLKRKAAEASAA